MIAFVQKYLVAGLMVAVGILMIGLALQSARVSNAKAETAKVQAAWSVDKAQAATASAKQSEEFRIKEAGWNKSRDENVRTAQEQTLAHEQAVRAGSAELDRLRATLAAYVARSRGAAAAPSVAGGSPPASDALDLLSNLYAGADEAAGIFADAADRARIAGLACERSYDATVN